MTVNFLHPFVESSNKAVVFPREYAVTQIVGLLSGLSNLTMLLRKFVHETGSSSIKCVLQGMVENIQLNES